MTGKIDAVGGRYPLGKYNGAFEAPFSGTAGMMMLTLDDGLEF